MNEGAIRRCGRGGVGRAYLYMSRAGFCRHSSYCLDPPQGLGRLSLPVDDVGRSLVVWDYLWIDIGKGLVVWDYL